MFELPDLHAQGPMTLRYEDITQDGRPRVGALPTALGVVWRGVAPPAEVRTAMTEHGIIPILTRLRVEAFDGPFSIEEPFAVRGSFSLAHAKSAAGDVERLFLDIETEVEGRLGRTNLPPPPGAGTIAAAGTVFAEHVFTRPFAAPDERKVLALPVGGGRFVPPRERAQRAPRDVITVPNTAMPLEGDFVRDDTPLVMGPTHTDSNQHVNSLVYPALFEEAVLRRLARLGRSVQVLARSLELGYRRPSFAGDTLRISLRTFTRDDAIECVGVFHAEDETDLAKARVYVRMTLR